MQPDQKNKEHDEAEHTPETPDRAPATEENAAAGVSGGALSNTIGKPTKRALLYAGVAVLAIAAVGFLLFMQYGSGNGFLSGGEKTGKAVAAVNGEEIARSAYETQVAQITSSAGQQGIDVENEETKTLIKEQAIDTLVNTELLVQGAADAGISVDGQAVEDQFQSIATQIGGEEALRSQISALGLTEEEVRANIADELVINQYISERIDDGSFAVTSEEVRAFYDEITAGQADVPPFEAVSGQLEAQLLETKEQEAILALIAELKETAEIEIYAF